MQIGLGRFSSYAVDVDALMTEVKREHDERYAKTARQPCTVRLHPFDRHAIEMALAAGHFGIAVVGDKPYSVLTVLGMPVISSGQHPPLGTIAITQCQTSLYHPGRCDCPNT